MDGDILVRAHVRLNGVRPGDEVWVNPNSPWIKGALSKGYLVVVDGGKDETGSGEDVEKVE